MSAPRFGHAIVLGGSMAGVVTAKALSRHVERVTVIERDELPDTPQGRRGVPQGDHLHVLLSGGAVALEQLFPGFGDGLLAAGAVPVDVPHDMLWLNPAGWVLRSGARFPLLSASRHLIEWHTRRLVAATPGIEIIDGRNVVDLRVSPDGCRVTGVTLAGSGVETLDADLVVDATGRRSHLPDWLERIGYDRPDETRIDAHLAYATRIYRRPPGDPGWKGIFVQNRPPVTSRLGVMFPIEGDRWLVTLQGVGADRPPTDHEGFERFAASLRSPVIHEAISSAEPLTEAVGFANTANRRRHFDRLRRWPERLVAIGDSVCAFNPVYGQGVTVAAQTAVVLDELLTRHRTLDGFARPMQRRVAKAGDAAWMIATGDDLRMPTTTGAIPSRAVRLQHRYLDRVLAAATIDETALAALVRVFFLLAPPTTLFRPDIVVRSLLHRRRPASLDAAPARPEPVAV